MSCKYFVLMALAAATTLGCSVFPAIAQSAPPEIVAQFEANPEKYLAEAKKEGKSIAAAIRDLVIADPAAAAFVTKFAASSGDALLQASIGAGLGQAATALDNSGQKQAAEIVNAAVGTAAASGDTALAKSYTATVPASVTAALGPISGSGPGTGTGPGSGPSAGSGAGAGGGASSGGNGGSVGGGSSGSGGGSSSGSSGGSSNSGGTPNSSSSPAISQGHGSSVSP